MGTTSTRPKKQSLPGTPNPRPKTTRAELEARRGGVVCPGPSGAVYKVRKPSLLDQAMAGGLPRTLLTAASTAEAIEALTDESLTPEQVERFRAYRRVLILATLVELESGEEVREEDLGSGELDDDPLIPVIDQEWAFALAQGFMDRDGLGRRIWGPEPLDRFAIFRQAHQCGDECVGCVQAVHFFTAIGDES